MFSPVLRIQVQGKKSFQANLTVEKEHFRVQMLKYKVSYLHVRLTIVV